MFNIPNYAFSLPWFMFDLFNKQLITSQTVPGDMSDKKALGIISFTLLLSVMFGIASRGEQSTANRREATMLAMERAVADIGASPDLVLVDGNTRIDIEHEHRTIVGGESVQRVLAVSAALATHSAAIRNRS